MELADRHSRASALMPQKRNPYALAAIRTQAGVAAGELAALLVTLHTGSARTDHFHLLNGSVPRLLDQSSPSPASRPRSWPAWRSAPSASRARPGRGSRRPRTSPTSSARRRGSITARPTAWSGARCATWSARASRPTR